MRKALMGLVIAVALAPLGALAQPEQAPAPLRGVVRLGGNSSLSAEERAAYCLWAGQLYSIGASFCSRQQTMTTCTEAGSSRSPIWVNKDNDKNCDRNPSWTPQ